MTQEGVENVSIEDVDGEGPFAGVRPNAGGGGIADDGDVLSVIVESRLLCIDLRQIPFGKETLWAPRAVGS
jgi:hypothetical protein